MAPRHAHIPFTVAVLTLCAFGDAIAQAQPPHSATATPAAPAVRPAIRDEVRKLHNDALAAYQRKDFAAAYEGFRQAWSLQRVPRIAGNLGRAELALQKYRDAAEHLALFLAEDSGLGEEERSKVSQQLAEAKAKVGTLRVETTPAGAEVLLDGALAGTAPLRHEIYVEPGRHVVQVRHAGTRLTREVEARAGSDETVKLDVPPPPPQPATPPPAAPPPSTPVRSSPFPIRTVLLVAGSVVAVGGGVLMGVGVAQKSDALAMVPKDDAGRSLCARPGSGDPDKGAGQGCDRVRSLAETADVLWGIGLGSLIAGSAILVSAALPVWPTSPTARAPVKSSLLPIVSPGSASVVWQGQF